MERWFGLLTQQLIRRGVHKNVVALENLVRQWINNWYQDPKPFVWTMTAEDILQFLSKYIARSLVWDPASASAGRSARS